MVLWALVWVSSFVVMEWNTYPVFPGTFWIFLNDGLKAFQKDLTSVLGGIKKGIPIREESRVRTWVEGDEWITD